MGISNKSSWGQVGVKEFFSYEFQPEILNPILQFFVVLRIEILRDGFKRPEGLGAEGCRFAFLPADEPVGQVDVGFAVGGGGVALEEVGDGDEEMPGRGRA